jgi:hypothetical protein
MNCRPTVTADGFLSAIVSLQFDLFIQKKSKQTKNQRILKRKLFACLYAASNKATGYNT